MRCAVIGLGEAGSRYADGLVGAGHQVTGFDPAPNPTPEGVERRDTIAEAVKGAQLVLVLTGAAASRAVAAECAGHLDSGCCYADFTSSAPRDMEELAAQIEKDGVLFADVAILGPVPLHGERTPVMVSGAGRDVVAAVLSGMGAPVENLDAPAGAAMAHKLLRSVLMKGLAAVVLEAVAAGRAAGSEQWIRDQIASQLAGDGHAVIERFITGTRNHAARRAQEMAEASAYLAELGVPAEMSRATRDALTRAADESFPA